MRRCSDCGIEFRPRGRVPIRVSATQTKRLGGWAATMIFVGVAAAIGVRVAMNSPPTSLPPPMDLNPIAMPAIEIPLFDSTASFPVLEPPSITVVTHRREFGDGRVVATGLLARPSSPIARPQVHVGFLGAEGVELGSLMADVACPRLGIDILPCPWGFSGLEPPGLTDLRIWATGQTDFGEFEKTAHLRFSFDDEFGSTRVECNLPELGEVHAQLIPQANGELWVGVGLPEGQSLRDPQATLVGYAEASLVELVIPMPSPVGRSRTIELPEHDRPIVRWQLWIDGPLRSW